MAGAFQNDAFQNTAFQTLTVESSFSADAIISLEPPEERLPHVLTPNITATGVFRPAKRIAPQQRKNATVVTQTNIRATQVVVESLVQADTANVRATQVVVESLVQTDTANARATQLVLEVLTQTRVHNNRDKNVTATGRWRPAARIAPQRKPASQIQDGPIVGDFTADAVIFATQTSFFTADATLVSTVSGSLTADAIVLRTASGSSTADAVVKRTQAGSFTADAVILATQAGSFTADAVVKRTQSGSFTADAWVLREQTGSFTADGIIFRTQAGSLSADAVVLRGQGASFSADAVIRREASGSFTADAVVRRTIAGSFTADAVVTLGACADPPTWTTPGDGVPISPTPTLAFTIPIANGNLHFDLQLDTVSTFDSGNLRIHQSYPDQTGWEYWNGSSWVAIPSGGIATSFVGNEARYTLQTPLADNTWYRRIRAVVVS